MNHRHLSSSVALGVLLLLAFGSIPTGSDSSPAEQALEDLEGTICKGDDPFKLPVDDDDVIWAAIQPHLTSPEGVFFAKDYELIVDEVDKSSGWVSNSRARNGALEAAGQLCSSEAECSGNTCTIKEGMLGTQWILEFRPDPLVDWMLVGYFTGNLDTGRPARDAQVAASIDEFEAEITSKLGDGSAE